MTDRVPAAPPRETEGARSDAREDIRLSEVVAALSYALDITEGQPEGHAVRSCLIGMRIAEAIQLETEEVSSLFYALLLKDLGCSSNSAKFAVLFGADDRASKWALKTVDWTSRVSALGFILRNAASGLGVREKARALLRIGTRDREVARELIEIRCERGAEIAHHIGFPPAMAEAIRALDEHWDGNGQPYGLSGEAIPILGRILGLSQTAEVFHASGGPAAACEVVLSRRGTWFDPHLVDAFMRVQKAPSFWETLTSPDARHEVSALEPADRVLTTDESKLDRIAEAFAQVIDAKSPWTFRHSQEVARYATGAAGVLGLEGPELRDLHRAALLHDIGKLSLSNLVLDKAGALSPEEIALVRRHPEYTERILERVSAFRHLAPLAGAHHECLDGSGYHRGITGESLSIPARLLGIADRYEAISAKRPYRDALDADETLAILQEDAGSKICAESLAALETYVRASSSTSDR